MSGLHVRGRWRAPIEVERDEATQSARWRGEAVHSWRRGEWGGAGAKQRDGQAAAVSARRVAGVGARRARWERGVGELSKCSSRAASARAGALECLRAQGRGGRARERERRERKGVEREREKSTF